MLEREKRGREKIRDRGKSILGKSVLRQTITTKAASSWSPLRSQQQKDFFFSPFCSPNPISLNSLNWGFSWFFFEKKTIFFCIWTFFFIRDVGSCLIGREGEDFDSYLGLESWNFWVVFVSFQIFRVMVREKHKPLKLYQVWKGSNVSVSSMILLLLWFSVYHVKLIK